MSDGFFLWYRAPWSRQGAAAVLRALATSELTYRNPETGAVTLIARDAAGRIRRQEATETELLDALLLTNADRADFHLWLPDGLDVFTLVRRGPTGLVVDFALDGLGDRQEQAIAALVRVAGRPQRSLQGFVLDRTGRTAATDWNAVLAGTERQLPHWPDLLALPHHHAERLTGPDPCPSAYQDGPLTVLAAR
ncbi:hypothetical protein ACFZB9_22895 [Kitasatospora sp. NPDC008050]|uniref:hypothetical protein n=1 Tax=Kitasatospora sp. NPDC008050 TaxID=3364021 RepID=UPI0036E921BB